MLLPSATVVLEISNIKTAREVTPLAWDVAAALSSIFHYSGEIVVAWDTPAHGFDHSYCLVFVHRG